MTPEFPEPAREIDAALLSKALDYVTAHPEEWNQGFWARQGVFCGSTACLAGTLVQLAGYEIDWTSGSAVCDGMGGLIAMETVDGSFIPTLARKLVGLDYDQVEHLFHYYGRDVGELWRRAADITDGAVVVPPEFVLAGR